MKVNELLMAVKNNSFNKNYDFDVKKYVPIVEKRVFVMDVISACTDDFDGFINVDRFKMNIYFDMKMLKLYTSLDISEDFEHMIEEYDILCEHGFLSAFISMFESDYKKMRSMLDDELYSLCIQNSIDAQVVKIANKINSFIEASSNALNVLDIGSILPDGFNVNEIVEKMKMLK